MEEDVRHDQKEIISPATIWSLVKVTGNNLDPKRNWYLVTQKLCGVRPNAFAQNEIFRRFPDEIRCIRVDDLKLATKTEESHFNKKQKSFYVISSFDLCAGLLRQRELPKDGFVMSKDFGQVVEAINDVNFGADLDSAPLESDLGGKTPNSPDESSSKELDSSTSSSNPEDDGDVSSFLTSYPMSSSETSSSSIEDTLKSPLGPTIKKRKVARECRKINLALTRVLEKYHESLSCVLGNAFLYGTDEEREEISKTISRIFDLAVEAHGAKIAIAELLLPETHQKLLDGMRVPDWVLLYFKLQTRLPDAGWQTLLNLS